MVKYANRSTREKNAEILDDLAKFYEVMALTVRRSMFVLMTLSIFSLGVLFVPDEYLVKELEKTIRTPILGIPISVEAYIYVGPVILITITAYMNVFLRKLYDIQNLPDYKRYPILLTLPGSKIAFLRNYIGSVHVIVVMILYCWFISPHPNSPYYFGFTCLVILTIYYGKLSGISRSVYMHFNFVLIAICIIGSTVILAKHVNRGYDLDRTIVDSKVNLSGLNFANVSLRYSNFQNVVMKRIDMRNAKLRGANFQSANLEFANLASADLRDADLSEADLEGVNLYGAKLSNTDLSNANMKNTQFFVTIENRYRWGIDDALTCSQLMSAKNVPKSVLDRICSSQRG